jgi:hypothetical protein
MIRKQIKQEIDACVEAEIDGAIPHIQQCYNLLLPYIQVNYNNSRDTVQFCIGQFQRVSSKSGVIQIAMAVANLRTIAPLFLNHPSPSLNYSNIKWSEVDVRTLLEKIAPLLSGERNASTLYPQIADALMPDERRKMVSYIIDSVQRYGLKTTWDKNTIENHIFLCSILYSICKKDDVMDLFFYFYYNVLDRMNLSGEHQLARDFAEGLLIIGYNENLLAESYYGACRAYTLANNPVAGLLYMNIALTNLAQLGKPIPQHFAFEILWQMLKIMRELGRSSEKDIVFMTKEFDKLGCNDYDKLSFYHTAFTIRVFSKDKTLPSNVMDFLNENREIFFRNIEHSAMPWFSLINGMRTIFPDADFSGLQLYENALNIALEKEGNEMFLDLYANKNIASHLKELLVKLKSTRERDDYSKDNRTALVFAKRLLSQAVEEENPGNYILAMQPKADFTFVLPANIQTQMYQQVKIEDVEGEEYNLYYQEIEILKILLQADDSDAVMWIGKGNTYFCNMILLRDMYNFSTLVGWHEIDIAWIQQDIISKLQYIKGIKKEGEPIYFKSDYELEREGDVLYHSLGKCILSIPLVTARIFFIKDLEIAAYPHQLFVGDRTDCFIGESMPSANVISTELFIKTNFDEPLRGDYSKAFWTPVDSGEFTFQVILGQLESLLQKYQFDVHCETAPIVPLHADLNIVCAHGGSNISETEWFYANDQPLIETRSIVGQGKLLILLVCHSGSITQTNYDNAMHTIIKRYIQIGYSSVVAPMWSLSTEIIPTWLSTFLECMDAGDYVVDAVFKANMQVKDEFIAPSAWACLHLFGNPYLQVGDKARIELIDESQQVD